MTNKTSIDGISAVLHTLMLIPQHRAITVRELEQQLADLHIYRTPRSIKRYLDEIIVILFNVECDMRTIPHTYRKKSEQLLKLGTKEAFVFCLIDKYLRPTIPIKISHTYKTLVSNSILLLNKGLKPSKERLYLDKVHMEVITPYPMINKYLQSLETIHSALFDQCLISISSQTLLLRHIKIEPLGLLIKHDSFVLIYRQHQKLTVHTIALELIDSAILSTFQFTYPSDFILKDFVTEMTNEPKQFYLTE
ncbi:transcriptional regulator [Aliivibrio wodanis]|uniref:transcriptional regulator n=1 Tax=Aliivibrio wodanis TaxID=80852 RepID=UPI00406D4DC7